MLEDEPGDIIKKSRTGLSLSVEDLAKETEITERNISLMEAYKLKPTKEHIEILSKALNLNAEKLEKINSGWQPKKHQLNLNELKITKIENDYYGYLVNNYILTKGNSSIAIDTGANPRNLLNSLKKLNTKLVALLITHPHTDHGSGMDEIKEQTGCEIYNESMDKDLNIESFELKVISTPGHTSNSVSYLIEKFIFVGDELFSGSIGNSEISYQEHLKNVKEKILSLPEDTIILPGHGPVTTVKEEKNNNPFFWI